MTITHAWERFLASDRRNAEDRAEVFVSAEDLVVIIADGAGGTPGGGSASDALVAAVSSELQRGGDSFDTRRWEKVFHETDAKLATHFYGETTGVLVVLGARGLVGVSAGDSEAWAVGATSIDDLTVHQRSARVGSGRIVAVTFERQALDGVLVVGSDGLFKYARPEAVAAIVRVDPPAEAARRLSELVRLSSGRLQDDLAVVVAGRARPD
jgi:serine/threonine protein phosphatase PrpC